MAAGLLLAGVLAGQGERLRQFWVSSHSPEQLAREAVAHPEDLLLQESAARRLLDAARPIEALPFAAAAARTAPDKADGWTLCGEAALRLGRTDQALAALQRALEINPRAAEPHLLLAQLYSSQNSSHGAVAELRRYTGLRPRDARGWLRLAPEFLALKEPGNALDAALRALRLDGHNPDAMAAAGEAARRLGDLPAAEARLRRALSLNPHHVAALVALARVRLSEGGGTPEAMRLLNVAITDAPADIDARCELARALAQQERRPEAILQWRKVLEQAPDEPRALHSLGQALARSGREKEAEAYLDAFQKERQYRRETEAAFQERPGDRAGQQFALARVELRYGHVRRAAAALRNGLGLDPENAWARRALARCESGP